MHEAMAVRYATRYRSECRTDWTSRDTGRFSHSLGRVRTDCCLVQRSKVVTLRPSEMSVYPVFDRTNWHVTLMGIRA